jgi:predicted DNA-binding protein (UPF0251 family)
MIEMLPGATFFKPRGVPLKELNVIFLPMEGLEALRLTDVEKLDQETAAKTMGISRQTFGRILIQAHQIVAAALVSGMALCIQGGVFRIASSKEDNKYNEKKQMDTNEV